MAGNENGEGSREWNRNKDEFKQEEVDSKNANEEPSGINPFAAWRGFNMTRNSGNLFNFVQPDIHKDHSDTISELECKKTEYSSTTKIEKEKTVELKVFGDDQKADSSASEVLKSLPNSNYFNQLRNLSDSFVKSGQLYLPQNSCSDYNSVFGDCKVNLDAANLTYPGKMVKTKEEMQYNTNNNSSNEIERKSKIFEKHSTTEMNTGNQDRKDGFAKKYFANEESSGINPFAAWRGFNLNRNCRNPFNFVQPDYHEAHSDAISKLEYNKAKNGSTARNIKGENGELTVIDVGQLHLPHNYSNGLNPVFDDCKNNLEPPNLTYPIYMYETKEEIQGTEKDATTKYNPAKRHFDNEEIENPGSFSALDEDEFNSRAIIKAKRLLPKEENFKVLPFIFSQNKLSSCYGNSYNFSKLEYKKADNGSTAKNIKGESGELTVIGVEQTVEQLHLPPNYSNGFNPVFDNYKNNLEPPNLTYPIYMDETKEEIQGTKKHATTMYKSAKRHFDNEEIENPGSFSALDEDQFNSRAIIKTKRLLPKEENFEMLNFNIFSQNKLSSCYGYSYNFSKPEIPEEDISSINTLKVDYNKGAMSGTVTTEDGKTSEVKDTGTNHTSFVDYIEVKRKQVHSILTIDDSPKYESSFQQEVAFAKRDLLSSVSEEEKNDELKTTGVNISNSNKAGEKRNRAHRSEHHTQYLTINIPSKNENSFQQKFIIVTEDPLSRNASSEDIANHSFSSGSNSNKEGKKGDETIFEPVITNASTFNFDITEKLSLSISSGYSTDFKNESAPEIKPMQLSPISNDEENSPLEKRLVQIPPELNDQQMSSRGLNNLGPYPHSLSFLPFPFRYHFFPYLSFRK